MNQILIGIRNFLANRFSLHDDKAEEGQIIESIVKSIEFKGTNLWTLIFAIFIASIGLNVNSTAVIIGAMLISPIMGPIMGIGLGIGINDFELIRKASKNLLIAAMISISVSTFYFFITPLQEAQSELLSRTTPSIWDVFIALFGGLAGIVAGTRKEKSNVIPGVAIATALMPPLCTAGYGLARGNLFYFIGALYLFFINSVFICISTFLIVRYMRLRKKTIESEEREKKISRYILFIVILTALPSVYLAYRIVQKSIFETNANLYLHREFNFKNSYIVNKTFKYNDGKKEIDVLLLGEDLTPQKIDSLKRKMSDYKIDAQLTIHQGLNGKQEIDVAQIKANILTDMIREQSSNQKKIEDTLAKLSGRIQPAFPDIKNELRSLYPEMKEYSISRSVLHSMDSTGADTVVLFWERSTRGMSRAEKGKLVNWLKSRIGADSILIISDSR